MPATLLKTDFERGFFCEFCKMFQITYIVEHLETGD